MVGVERQKYLAQEMIPVSRKFHAVAEKVTPSDR